MFGHALNLSVASKVSPSAHVFFRELSVEFLFYIFYCFFDRPVVDAFLFPDKVDHLSMS